MDFHILTGQSNAIALSQSSDTPSSLPTGAMKFIADSNSLSVELLEVGILGATLEPGIVPSRPNFGPGGAALQDLTNAIDARLSAASGKIAGIFWVHGSSDATNGAADKYQANLKTFYDTLIARYSGDLAPDFQFIVLGLAKDSPLGSQKFNNFQQVIDAQQAFVLGEQSSNVAYIEPEAIINHLGYNSKKDWRSDGLHYTKTSGEAVSYAYFDQFYTGLNYESVVVRADGHKYTQRYADSVIRYRQVKDIAGGNEEDWAFYTDTFYSNGDLSTRLFTMDDGSTKTLSYAQDYRVSSTANVNSNKTILSSEIFGGFFASPTATVETFSGHNFGSATISGSDIIFNPGENSAGIASFDFFAKGTNNLEYFGTLEVEVLIDSTETADVTIYGIDSNDSLSGGAGNDTFLASNGDDTLRGNGGDDTINGGAGDDTLHGGEGKDILNGQTGNDRLASDAGADTLNGGDGFDTYVFSGTQDQLNVVYVSRDTYRIQGLDDSSQWDQLINIEQLELSDGTTLSLSQFNPPPEDFDDYGAIVLVGVIGTVFGLGWLF